MSRREPAGFAQTPRIVWRRNLASWNRYGLDKATGVRLNRSERALAAYLESHIDGRLGDGMLIRASVNQIADELDANRRSVTRWLKVLEAAGVVRVTKQANQHRPRTYALVVLPAMNGYGSVADGLIHRSSDELVRRIGVPYQHTDLELVGDISTLGRGHSYDPSPLTTSTSAPPTPSDDDDDPLGRSAAAADVEPVATHDPQNEARPMPEWARPNFVSEVLEHAAKAAMHGKRPCPKCATPTFDPICAICFEEIRQNELRRLEAEFGITTAEVLNATQEPA